MKAPLFVLAHGWGLRPSIWEPLLAHGSLADVLLVDLGFFGPASRHALPADRPLVGIGHSLGFPWLLRQEVPWDALVAIGGFCRFTAGEDFPEGVASRVLSRMQAKLPGATERVVSDFLARCGLSDFDLDGHSTEALAEGLGWLSSWDERDALRAHRGSLLALAGEADPIVPPSVTRATFPADAIRWQAEGGHLLPLSHPSWCASALSSFLEEHL